MKLKRIHSGGGQGGEWKPTKGPAAERVVFAEVEYKQPGPNESSGEFHVPEVPVQNCDFAVAGFTNELDPDQGVVALAVYIVHKPSVKAIHAYLDNIERGANEGTNADQICDDYLCISGEILAIDTEFKNDAPKFEHLQIRRDYSLEEFKTSLEGQLQFNSHFIHEANDTEVRIASIGDADGQMLYVRCGPTATPSDRLGASILDVLIDMKLFSELNCHRCNDQSAIQVKVEVELFPVLSSAEEGSVSSSEMPADAKEPSVQISDEIHPPQRKVAERLYTRAVHLLGGKSKFNKFKSMKFIILTPVFSTLVNQTANRVVKHNLCAKEERNEHVCAYSNNNREHFEAFKDFAIKNPECLCVMTADDCHWGVVRNTPDYFGAHDRFVNDSELLALENVLVVLISATPYNVMTCKSRIPEKHVVINGSEIEAARKGDANSEELHVVKWFAPEEMPDGKQPVTLYRRLEQYLQTVASDGEGRMLCHQCVRPCLSY